MRKLLPAMVSFLTVAFCKSVTGGQEETGVSERFSPRNVIVFVMATTQNGTFFNWRTRSEPALQTWVKDFENTFFVFPDNFHSRKKFREPECQHTVRDIPSMGVEPLNIKVTEITCPDLYHANILLTPAPLFPCNDDYRGEGPCCKTNFAFWYILAARRELLQPASWVAYLDDDVYLHSPGVMGILRPLDPTLNLAVVPGNKCFLGPIFSTINSKCMALLTDMFWAHPVFLSSSAVLKIAPGIFGGGIMDQCRFLNVSHECGFGQFLWMYSVGCVAIEELRLYSPQAQLHPLASVLHRARPNNKMKRILERLDVLNNQSQPIPDNAMMMKTIHNYLRKYSRFNEPDFIAPARGVRQVQWPLSYASTVHSAKFDIGQEWHSFGEDDCIKMNASS